MALGLALDASLAAVDATVPVATVAPVYLAGSAIASAAPTPGGLGATEAAFAAALTAVGVGDADAVSGVLLYRLVTVRLPILPGYLSHTHLRRADAGFLSEGSCEDRSMAIATEPRLGQDARVDAILERLAELQGQRNVVDAAIVEVVRELEEDDLWAITGARSLEACVAWKTGASRSHAESLTAVARRTDTFPQCMAGFREGSLSLDQVAVIADKAADGSDDHYAQFARFATVSQLRKAVSLAPRPDTGPRAEPERSVTKITDDEFEIWRIKLPHVDAAVFDAALQSHLDALVAEWKRDHGERDEASQEAPPFPTVADAFLRLVEHGWDADAVARPHGHRTTVVLHLDVESQVGSLHMGPALSEAERRYLTCDSRVEVWFEKDGKPIGVGRETREIPRRIRRALERRHPTCAVPGCGATRGLHAHHIWHWEDGGPTELWNLVLVCPFHHRLHHRKQITIRGPGDAVTVTDVAGRVLDGSSVARPPTGSPPDVNPYAGPTGEHADWKWYVPYEPRASRHDN